MNSGISVIEYFNAHPYFFSLIVAWALVWKGMGLWRAAGLRQKWWFVAIFVLNTMGILEIIYLFLISKNYKVEVIEE